MFNIVLTNITGVGLTGPGSPAAAVFTVFDEASVLWLSLSEIIGCYPASQGVEELLCSVLSFTVCCICMTNKYPFEKASHEL